MKKANVFFMTIAGLLLIIAAILKAHQIITVPVVKEGFWESWLFFVIQVPLELSLGIWLVSGLFRKAAWLVGTIAYMLFIGITLQKALSGAESCGCFGQVHVNPWITLGAIDIPIFLLLLIFRPIGQKLLPPPWPGAKHFIGVAWPASVIIAVLVPVLVFNKPSDKGVIKAIEPPKPPINTRHKDPNEVTPPVNVKIEPNEPTPVTVQNPAEDPNQKPDPLAGFDEWEYLKDIDIADYLRGGRVVVMLHRHDCPTCHDAVPIYEQICYQLLELDEPVRITYVEVPPYAPEEQSLIPKDSVCISGKLLETQKWYVMTPFVVAMQDGIPVKSWEGQAPDYDEIVKTYTDFFGK